MSIILFKFLVTTNITSRNLLKSNVSVLSCTYRFNASEARLQTAI